MPKFRSKPAEIEATQWMPGEDPPQGLTVVSDIDYSADGCLWPAYGFVTTIHGERATVHYGDWVIAEPDGIHYYPCKPEVFEKRRELIQP